MSGLSTLYPSDSIGHASSYFVFLSMFMDEQPRDDKHSHVRVSQRHCKTAELPISVWTVVKIASRRCDTQIACLIHSTRFYRPVEKSHLQWVESWSRCPSSLEDDISESEHNRSCATLDQTFQSAEPQAYISYEDEECA